MNNNSIIGEWMNHNWVKKQFVDYLLMHPTQVELLKPMEIWTRYGHANLGGLLVENGKSQNTWSVVNVPFFFMTKQPTIGNCPTPTSSSNTMSMQIDHFL